MSQFGWYFFSAGGLSIVSLIAALVLWFRSRGALARIVAIPIFAFVILSVYAVDWVLARPLVAGYRPFTVADAPSGKLAIVLLGGGGDSVEDWDGHLLTFPYQDEAARTLEAARVFKLMPSAVVISSGGATPDMRESSAVVMQRVLVQLGVPPSQIVLEDRSRTTHDEAVLVKPMLARLGIDRVILVTSDIHMRRSMATFRDVGLDPVPAIARGAGPSTRTRWYIPTEDGLGYAAQVLHEYGGLVVYGVRGWLAR
jgi:uncharacterized SAM-binding protein YcdF (DUF218 family)